MSADAPIPPSFGDRLFGAFTAFLRALVRILLVLILAVILAAAVYFGAPALYRRYVRPVEQTLVRLNEAQADQEQTNRQLNQRLDELQSRLDDLELQSDLQKQTLDELASRLDGNQAINPQEDTSARLDEIEAALEAATSNQDVLRNEIGSINQMMEQTSTQLRELSADAQDGVAPLQALRNELQMLKAMEYLTRSRLSLVENNLGLAEQDIESVRALLALLQSEVPSYQADILSEVIARLEAALSNLPVRPTLATENLEIAWQLLQNGLPTEPPPQPTLTFTPTPFATPTPAGTP
jgi:chromosome segregation ATPase